MRPTTLFLAKLMGLIAVLTAGWMMLDREEALDRIHDIVQDRDLSLTWGVFTLTAGLAVVIGHNVWRGGLLPIVVTLVGWLILLKGVAMMVMPSSSWTEALARLHFDADYYAWLAVPLAIGAYLTLAGFLHPPGRG
jgi:hypothetical protein